MELRQRVYAPTNYAYVVDGRRPVFIVGLLLANPTFATNAEFPFIDLQHHIPFKEDSMKHLWRAVNRNVTWWKSQK